MGLFDAFFGQPKKKSEWDTYDDDWFDHSGEDHDMFEGHCMECEEDEEDLED